MDDPRPSRVGQELAQALDRAALVVVPGAGHVVNLEARDAVNAALRAFLLQFVPA